VVSSSYIRSAIDEALRDHMKELFAATVRHIGSSAAGNDATAARASFRKSLATAMQAHSEMTAIVKEEFGE
jgi:hypothetical protein